MATNQPKTQSDAPVLSPTILIVPKVNFQQDKTSTSHQLQGTSQSVTAPPHSTQSSTIVPTGQKVLLNLQQAQIGQNANITLGNNFTLTLQPAQPAQQVQKGTGLPGGVLKSVSAKLEGSQPRALQPAGPRPAGPQLTSPQLIGLQSAGLRVRGPGLGGPHPTGPQPPVLQPRGLQPQILRFAGPLIAGTQLTSPQPTGLRLTSPQPEIQQPTGQQPTVKQPIRPQFTGLQPTGTFTTAPKPTGPQLTGSQSTGPQPIGQQPTGPLSTGPLSTGPLSTVPQLTVPQRKAPQPTGPRSTSQQPIGQQPTGPQPMVPPSTGPQLTSPQPIAPQPIDPQTTGPQTTGQQTGGSLAIGSQPGGAQVKLESKNNESAKQQNKVGAFLKPPPQQTIQVPHRVYKTSLAAVQMKQVKQIEKQAKTVGSNQPANPQPAHISAILLKPKQAPTNTTNVSVTMTTPGPTVAVPPGKTTTGSPTSVTKSQPVLVQTAMSPKIIVQAAPTGPGQQAGQGKQVLITGGQHFTTGGQHFTIVPNSQGTLLTPAPHFSTSVAPAVSRTISPTVAQLARQQRLQKITQAAVQQQQQPQVTPSAISPRSIVPVHITSTVSGTQAQLAVATSPPTFSSPGQFQYTPRMSFTVTTPMQQQQQPEQSLAAKSKITLGQVGAISNVHHLTSSTATCTLANTTSQSGGPPGTQGTTTIIAPQQTPLTIIPKHMLSGTGQFILSSGIQVPQGTFNLQPGSVPLTNVQAKLVQTPIQAGNSTQAGLQTNIMLQALPHYSQAQPKLVSPTWSQVQVPPTQSSSSASVVQPKLIQTCGAQATIGLIQVNMSQPQQSLATVNSPSHPIVQATIQASIPHSQAEGASQQPPTYQPQLLQLTGLPNQQYLQIVPQPQAQQQQQLQIQQIQQQLQQQPQQQPNILQVPVGATVSQAAASVPIAIAPRIPSPKLCSPHPVLTPIAAEAEKLNQENVSSIDLALKYSMPYAQAPIPYRKRSHSEIENGSADDDNGKDDVKKDEDNNEFSWEEYLDITGSKPAPHTAFKHVEASIDSGISVGMKVEVRVPQSAYTQYRTYWVASVVASCGSLLLLRYGGYGNDRSGDFWVNMALGELHPIGWCARSGRSLRPPDELLKRGPRDWGEFLLSYLTGAKSIPEYVLYIRKVSSPTPVDRIKKGMRVEVLDNFNPRHAWIAIIKETYGGRLRLRYSGIDEDTDDFWLFYLSWRIHPIGWAKEKLVFMKPPQVLKRKLPNNTEAAWNTTYQYSLSSALKEAAFPKEFFKDQPKIRCHRFKMGMRLEAVNPKVPSQICPATVSEWLNDKSFLVTIDNLIGDDKNKITFMCTAESGGIFPVNWCEKHGYALTPPKGYTGARFQWSSYLKQNEAKAASKDLFRIYMRDHEFRPSMKLEAANPFCPSEICIATITKVVNRHMWIHFDNSKLPNLVVDTESFDIFPVGWCESNGYVLKAPKKLVARKAKKVAIVWPEKHTPQPAISSLSPGRDLYQKVKELSRDEDSAEGHGTDWTTKVFFNHKCFSGPYLSKGRIAELPKAVGPGIVVLVLREVLSLLINAAYTPPRVLKELEIESEETAGMNGHLQVMKAKHKGKSYRSLVEICKSSSQVTDYLRTACIKLECCPSLVSLTCVKDEEECPDKCASLTKTKNTYQFAKKRKFQYISRPSGSKAPLKPLLPPVRKGNKRRKKRRPFVHRKRHILLQDGVEENGNDDGMNEEEGRGIPGGASGLIGVKRKNTSQTMAHALLQSAKRKKIHPLPPKLVLPHRERGTKLKTFAAMFTSNRAQKKAEKEKSIVTPANHNKPKTKALLANNKPDDRLHLTSNPLKWSTNDVVKFISKTDCATLARIFEEQEIDGQALLLLTLPTVQECMDLKLGPAIKLCHHIERVKIAFYDQFAK